MTTLTPDEQHMWDLTHVETGLDGLRDPAEAIELVRNLRTQRKLIAADRNLSDEAKAQALQKLKEEATGSVSYLRGIAQAKLKEAREAASAAANARKQPGEDQVAYELRLSRAHDRVRRLLDGGMPAERVAELLAGDGDRVAFDALRSLAADDLQAKNARPQERELVAQLFDKAETPLLSKVELKAREILTRAEEQEAFATMNLAGLEAEASGSGTADLFVTSRDRVIDIESGNPIGHHGRPVAEVGS